jgi:hypothetical protein
VVATNYLPKNVDEPFVDLYDYEKLAIAKLRDYGGILIKFSRFKVRLIAGYFMKCMDEIC